MSTELDWLKIPRVAPDDFGIRPGGKPDECFYCLRKVGEQHLRKCVIITRLVRLRVTLRQRGREVSGLYVEALPADWSAEDIEFSRNESTWCADNVFNRTPSPLRNVSWQGDIALVDEIRQKAQAGKYCTCGDTNIDFVEFVDNILRSDIWVPDDLLHEDWDEKLYPLPFWYQASIAAPGIDLRQVPHMSAGCGDLVVSHRFVNLYRVPECGPKTDPSGWRIYDARRK